MNEKKNPPTNPEAKRNPKSHDCHTDNHGVCTGAFRMTGAGLRRINCGCTCHSKDTRCPATKGALRCDRDINNHPAGFHYVTLVGGVEWFTDSARDDGANPRTEKEAAMFERAKRIKIAIRERIWARDIRTVRRQFVGAEILGWGGGWTPVKALAGRTLLHAFEVTVSEGAGLENAEGIVVLRVMHDPGNVDFEPVFVVIKVSRYMGCDVEPLTGEAGPGPRTTLRRYLGEVVAEFPYNSLSGILH